MFCASLRRLAITLRSLVIFTRSSRGPTSRGSAGAEAGLEAAGAGAAALPLFVSIKLFTSSLVKRSPSAAGTCVASRLLSASILRTAGDVFASSASLAAGTADKGSDACSLAVSSFAAGFSSAAGAGAAPLPEPSSPRTAPTSTVSPSATIILAITPSAGAFTSSVTLSVSSSTIASSAFTASPSFLSHCATVASLTDSPKVGTTISVIRISLLFYIY